MKKIAILIFATLLCKASFASERSIEAWIAYNQKEQMDLNSCLEGNQESCRCSTLEYKLRRLQSRQANLESDQKSSLASCYGAAYMVTSSPDGLSDYEQREKMVEECKRSVPANYVTIAAQLSADVTVFEQKIAAGCKR